jgi:ABC-2 type transport system ATP-binding protein
VTRSATAAAAALEPEVVLPAVEALSVSRRFGPKLALDDVSLAVAPGEIHAVLGPNGAGKTTLVRVLVGLVRPDSGEVRLPGRVADATTRHARRLFSFVPSGDRTFYLRLTGLENLAFFARLYGFSRRAGVARAKECLERVELSDQQDVRVGTYSHGMQKRLAIARALLVEPPLMIFDESTHDLDPPSARHIQTAVKDVVSRGTAVLWATQRVDEIRGFCDRVTLLNRGRVRFRGSVPQLMAHGTGRRYILHVAPTDGDVRDVVARARTAVGSTGDVAAVADEPGRLALTVRDGVILGSVITDLTQAGIAVAACTPERSEIEDAFLSLIEDVP